MVGVPAMVFKPPCRWRRGVRQRLYGKNQPPIHRHPVASRTQEAAEIAEIAEGVCGRNNVDGGVALLEKSDQFRFMELVVHARGPCACQHGTRKIHSDELGRVRS